jgi:hypothetical protein
MITDVIVDESLRQLGLVVSGESRFGDRWDIQIVIGAVAKLRAELLAEQQSHAKTQENFTDYAEDSKVERDTLRAQLGRVVESVGRIGWHLYTSGGYCKECDRRLPDHKEDCIIAELEAAITAAPAQASTPSECRECVKLRARVSELEELEEAVNAGFVDIPDGAA